MSKFFYYGNDPNLTRKCQNCKCILGRPGDSTVRCRECLFKHAIQQAEIRKTKFNRWQPGKPGRPPKYKEIYENEKEIKK